MKIRLYFSRNKFFNIRYSWFILFFFWQESIDDLDASSWIQISRTNLSTLVNTYRESTRKYIFEKYLWKNFKVLTTIQIVHPAVLKIRFFH